MVFTGNRALCQNLSCHLLVQGNNQKEGRTRANGKQSQEGREASARGCLVTAVCIVLHLGPGHWDDSGESCETPELGQWFINWPLHIASLHWLKPAPRDINSPHPWLCFPVSQEASNSLEVVWPGCRHSCHPFCHSRPVWAPGPVVAGPPWTQNSVAQAKFTAAKSATFSQSNMGWVESPILYPPFGEPSKYYFTGRSLYQGQTEATCNEERGL